jgi:hypothetical protein
MSIFFSHLDVSQLNIYGCDLSDPDTLGAHVCVEIHISESNNLSGLWLTHSGGYDNQVFVEKIERKIKNLIPENKCGAVSRSELHSLMLDKLFEIYKPRFYTEVYY